MEKANDNDEESSKHEAPPEEKEKEQVPPQFTIISRQQWGARAARYPGLQPLRRPATSVLLRYWTGWQGCRDAEQCKPVVKEIQKRDQRNDLVDIAHNFLIARDGTIFEGRGWMQSESPDFDLKRLGKHINKPKLTQESTINLAYIGNFHGPNDVPEIMKQAVQDIIKQGINCYQIAEKHKFMYVHEHKGTDFNALIEQARKKTGTLYRL